MNNRGPLRAVQVVLKTGTTIRGALIDERRNALILRAGQIAVPDTNQQVTWRPLDGDVVIPMENIDFYQDALDATTLNVIP